MKKNVKIILAVLVIIVGVTLTSFLLFKKNEIKDSELIDKIINDSNLEIILNLKDFDKNNFSEGNLLEVSMQLADKLGYKNETAEGDYLEFVTPSNLHEIIKDLTDITIEAPIQIEDFIYRYDTENEYYYYVPLGDVFPYKISKIDHVYKNDDVYTIECTASKKEDGENTNEEKFITKLKYIENNKYTKYQVVSQSISN